MSAITLSTKDELLDWLRDNIERPEMRYQGRQIDLVTISQQVHAPLIRLLGEADGPTYDRVGVTRTVPLGVVYNPPEPDEIKFCDESLAVIVALKVSFMITPERPTLDNPGWEAE